MHNFEHERANLLLYMFVRPQEYVWVSYTEQAELKGYKKAPLGAFYSCDNDFSPIAHLQLLACLNALLLFPAFPSGSAHTHIVLLSFARVAGESSVSASDCCQGRSAVSLAAAHGSD